jgi:Subtilase family/WD40-like Beta Propeller Repeat
LTLPRRRTKSGNLGYDRAPVQGGLRRIARFGVAGAACSALLWSGGALAAGETTRGAGRADAAALTGMARLDPSGRLDARLAAVAHAAQGSRAAASRSARQLGVSAPRGRVSVVVAGERARAAVERAGGAVVRAAAGVVRGEVPPARLAALAADPAAARVRAPALHRPAATAELDDTMAPVWHAAGVKGAGVKLAVVDLGFAGLAESAAAGGLPAGVATVDFCGPGGFAGTDHGTRVAEVAHVLAPEAELTLICIEDEVGLQQAVEYAVAQGVDVINHSVSWYDTGRGDGSGGPGSPDAAVRAARQAGIVWVSAAGNDARTHWGGAFGDLDGDDVHDFTGDDNLISLVAHDTETLCVALKWDAWPVTSEDYDLYLLREADMAVLAASTTSQAEAPGAPYEELCYANDTGGPVAVGVAIVRHSAASSPRLDLFVLGDSSSIEHAVAAGSIAEPASSPYALAAGAGAQQGRIVSDYSARGPTVDGRPKPELLGLTDVRLSPAFGGVFEGTSPAAASVAGAAALILAADEDATAADVEARLLEGARELGAPGREDASGAGGLMLPWRDDATVAFSSSFSLDLAHANGALERSLYRPLRNFVWAAAWSRDGRFLTFASDEEGSERRLYVIESDGTGMRALPHSGPARDQPSWSPDGTRIAFTRNAGFEAPFRAVAVADADGAHVTQLAAPGAGPSWSPDGSKIAYAIAAPPSYQEDIAVMAPDGSGTTVLTSHAGHDYAPAWSPDGSRIAFLRTESGQIAVYVMNADGSEVTRVSNTGRDAGSQPSPPDWTADGSGIVFHRNPGGLRIADPGGSGGETAPGLSAPGRSTIRRAWRPAQPSTAPQSTAAPEIDGTGRPGHTLHAWPGGWINPRPVSFAYSWSRCNSAGLACAPIPAADEATYDVEEGDVDARLRVTVTATNAHGSTAATSSSVAVRPDSLPETLITSGPSGTSVAPRLEFGLQAEGATSLECRLGGAAWTACQSGVTYHVAPGAYVFEARAVNGTTPDPTPARREVRLVRPFVVDLDGDRRSNIAVWRPTSGAWLVRGSATSYYGLQGDVPLPGDYDGDPAADLAVFRPPSGGWLVQGSAPVFHGARNDVPVPADYDRDGKTDVAVWRPDSGGWYIRGTATTFFGRAGDTPLPGDYDADPELDLAVFRPANGGWYVQGSPTVYHGQQGDVPVPADWDGDGKTEIAVYRPATSTWYLHGIGAYGFGRPGDVPLAGNFDDDPAVDKVVWRPATGAWYVDTGTAAAYFGSPDDIP